MSAPARLLVLATFAFGCATSSGPAEEAFEGDDAAVTPPDDVGETADAALFPFLDRAATGDAFGTVPRDVPTARDVPAVDTGSACAAPRQACGGGCVDTAINPTHCGGCNRPCGTGETCVGGACRSSCVAPRANCAGGCVDLATDTANCGACGRTCTAGQSCLAGICSTTSSGGSGSVLGQACISARQCGTLACITDFPGGYCSEPCVTDDDCGAAGICVDDGAGFVFCARTCSSPAQCRSGYTCLPLAPGVRACLP